MRTTPTPGDQAAGGTAEARRRLLQAWRGEVEAAEVYRLLAERERDPRRAETMREMAGAEREHRRRIEARLTELGVPVPNPTAVRLSPWRRRQLRLASADRVLAARSVAEEEEIKVRYCRPTGDAATDDLLSCLREEESGHARQIRALRRGGNAAPDQPPDQALGARSLLGRILGRERGQPNGAGWVSGAIYGANDGLAAVFGIVSGVSVATDGSSFVLTAGLAGAVASALSMAVGAFLAERAEAEVAHANLARQRREVAGPSGDGQVELSRFYRLKGLSPPEADALAAKLARNPEAMRQVLAAEQLGGAPTGGNPAQAALAAGLSTGLGAIVPVLPFFWLAGTTAIAVAAAVSIAAHFLVGAAKSLVTVRRWWTSGLEMTFAGVVVGACTYLLGLLFRTG